jgi:pyocin large subunit-like protein
MALQTKGFLNDRQRRRHFTEHGADFGAMDAKEYEELADTFLGGPAPLGSAHECTRKMGDKLRYDPTTQAYGVLDSRGVIRTFYKPVPCASLSAASRVAMQSTGRCHGHANNFLYFQSECRRW